MPELVKIDLLFVKLVGLTPQIKIHVRPEPIAAILENAVFLDFHLEILSGIGAHFYDHHLK